MKGSAEGRVLQRRQSASIDSPMTVTHLTTLAQRAIDQGWTSAQGNIASMLEDALELGWQAVPIRRGEPALGTLRAIRAQDAPQHSLSAMVGYGEQPLHTDGAHLRVMPDIVMLAAVAPTPTPTLLCDPGMPTEAQRTGVFKVGGGSRAFYASAVGQSGEWRYDPGCMIPVNPQAHEAARHVATLRARAIEYHWREPNTVLVIANRRVLHARAAVLDPQGRRVQRVALISQMRP